MKRTLTKIITGLIVATAVGGSVASTAFATTGDNPITANIFSYKCTYNGSVIRVDVRPGYTQTTSVNSIYNTACKEAKYVAAGKDDEGYYSTAKEHIKSTNIYVYTPYHAVSADTIRRYHTGLVRQTNQKASQIVEKYCRTVYKSIG